MKCGFIGHREINNAEKIKNNVSKLIGKLILKGIFTYNFGSKSKYDDLCWEAASHFQKSNNNIKLVDYYCGNEHPKVNRHSNKTEKSFDEIIYSRDNSKNLYVERNKLLIDNSDIIVFFYDEKYSGTKIAYQYAKDKNKIIINLFFKQD